MKTQTLRNRLEKRFNGSKNSIAYKVANDLVNNTNNSYVVNGDIIRPTTSSKRGVVCYMADIVSILNLLGVKHETGNDSPRGGAAGNFIKVTHKITY